MYLSIYLSISLYLATRKQRCVGFELKWPISFLMTTTLMLRALQDVQYASTNIWGWLYIYIYIYICGGLWEPYPSHHNGLFSPLLILRDFATREADQYRCSIVTLSFLCNIICYLISMFAFSLVTISGATTVGVCVCACVCVCPKNALPITVNRALIPFKLILLRNYTLVAFLNSSMTF